MSFPSFATGEVLTAADMNAVGLWLVATASNSNTTTLVIDNCFSSNYRNYRIIFTSTGGNVNVRDLAVQYRIGTTPTATNYVNHAIVSTNTAGPTRIYGLATYAVFGSHANFGSSFVVDVMNPQVASLDTLYSTSFQAWGSSSNIAGTSQGIQQSMSAFTGFQITSTDAFTGTARVYGYRN
jgi:hypothetical protein